MIVPQPYVNRQGLRDSFEDSLIKLQVEGIEWLSPRQRTWRVRTEDWQSRLAMVASIHDGDSRVVPAQAVLEKSEYRKSWNVNYLSHGWHRYVGRFPPQIVRAVLNAFRVAHPQVILDPFAGSGTTLVEAELMGIDAIGVEICPLSHLISEVKCRLDFPAEQLEHAWASVEKTLERARPARLSHYLAQEDLVDAYRIPEFPNREKWFNRDVLKDVTLLLSAISRLDDAIARRFLFVAVSASMRSLANVDVDVVRTEYRRRPRTGVDVVAVVGRKVHRMTDDLRTFARMSFPPASVSCGLGDARRLDLPSSSIDFVITSPPYGIEAISYLRTHMLSYRVLAPVLEMDYAELARRMIGTEFVMDWDLASTDLVSPTAQKLLHSYTRTTRQEKNRVAQMIQYFQDIEKALCEIVRVLKSEGHAAIIIGNKKLLGRTIPADAILQETARHFSLRTRRVLPVKLVCNNPTSQTPWSERMIRDEHIIFLEKE